MTKNKLEKLFSASLKAENKYIWGMKLHNNMLAHQTTPADYILTLERNFNPKTILVECKQVTCENNTGIGRFAFKRLKQLHDLIAFENLKPFHESYLCLGYYDHGWTHSEIYIVPIKFMEQLIHKHNAKSLNRKMAKILLKDYEVKLIEGKMDLWQLK